MSLGYSITTLTTGTYASDDGFDIYYCDCTAGDITLTLNDEDADGKFYWIKRIDDSGNVLTIDTSDIALFDAEETIIMVPSQSVFIVKQGFVWRVMSSYIPA